MKDETTLERDTRILTNFINSSVETLEKGEATYVKDGYSYDNKGGVYDEIIQRHSNKIVAKLLSLGYEYTTNHGFGCKDWRFTKKITL
jgi:hypothetical protein